MRASVKGSDWGMKMRMLIADTAMWTKYQGDLICPVCSEDRGIRLKEQIV